MATYIVIGAKRIQQWITRTPRLALTKGISQTLTTRTPHGRLSGRLLEGLRLSDGVPDIAGVVVLESDGPVTDDIVDAALIVVAQGLPGLEWNIQVYKADNYVEAYQATGDGQCYTRVRHRVPSTRRLPMFTEYEGCHEESAEVLVAIPEGKDSYDADCVVRRETFKQWKDTPKPREDSVVEPEMFKHLTEIEEPGEDDHPVRAVSCRDADNHLALVLTDGNRIGDFLKKVTQLKNPQAHKALSKALDDATRKAAEQARETVIAAMANPKFCPDVLHYIGGDDVMANITGRFAWLWAVTLTETFESGFRSRAGDVCGTSPQFEEVRTAAGQASLGVDMVFTHYKTPFAKARELAEKTEGIAKKMGKGKKPYITQTDTTTDHKALERNVTNTERASRGLRGGHVLRDLGSSVRGALKQGLDAGRNTVTRTRHTKRGIVEYLEQSSGDQIHADLGRAHWRPVVKETEEGQE